MNTASAQGAVQQPDAQKVANFAYRLTSWWFGGFGRVLSHGFTDFFGTLQRSYCDFASISRLSGLVLSRLTTQALATLAYIAMEFLKRKDLADVSKPGRVTGAPSFMSPAQIAEKNRWPF